MTTETENVLLKMLEEKSNKERKATYFKYGVIGLLGIAYAFVMVKSFKTFEVAPKPDTAYAVEVSIVGEIGPGKDASYEKIAPLLEKAFKDDQAKGVILKINSPGGTPVQSALIHDRIKELKKKHNKKVLAVGEDLMASGAYLIAMSADTVVVNRSTITGSIGVVSRGFGLKGLMDKLGVERRVATAGESKNLMDPFSEQTPKDTEKQKELLLEIHNHFKQVVVDGRGSKLKESHDYLFTGAVWTGSKALELGLVDKVDSKENVAKALWGVNSFYEYKQPKNILSNLMTISTSIQAIKEIVVATETPPVSLF